jgi:hypothetical protein
MLNKMSSDLTRAIRLTAQGLASSIVLCCSLTLLLSGGCDSVTASKKEFPVRPADRSLVPARAEIKTASRLVLDRTTYDFGHIKTGTNPMAVFRLTNEGTKAVRITGVKKCCGAVVKLEKNELLPGESGVLTAEFSIGQSTGLMERKIGVVTDAGGNTEIELTVKAEIMQTLSTTPSRLSIRAFSRLECPEITIKSLDGTAFAIRAFAASGGSLTAAFDPNRKATTFTLKPTVDMARIEALPSPHGSIAITLDHPDNKSVNLAFDVIRALDALPPQVVMFNAKNGESVSRVVQLRDNEADPNANTSPTIESVGAKNGSRVALRGVTPKKAGCDLNLEIWPAKSKDNEVFSSDQLVVKLKDGRELAVPLRVFFQSPTVSSTAGQGAAK